MLRAFGTMQLRIHHTERHEAVFATEGNLLSEWVEIHKSRCRNIGPAFLVKTNCLVSSL